MLPSGNLHLAGLHFNRCRNLNPNHPEISSYISLIETLEESKYLKYLPCNITEPENEANSSFPSYTTSSSSNIIFDDIKYNAKLIYHMSKFFIKETKQNDKYYVLSFNSFHDLLSSINSKDIFKKLCYFYSKTNFCDNI